VQTNIILLAFMPGGKLEALEEVEDVEGYEERKEQSMPGEEEDHNRTTQNNSSNTDQILTVAKVLESSVKNISPIHFSVPKTARPAARRFTGHKWAKSDSAQNRRRYLSMPVNVCGIYPYECQRYLQRL